MRNPQLREEPRHQKAALLPTTQRETILDWLKRNNKLQSRTPVDEEALNEDEDFDELVEDDDALYSDDDETATEEEE